MTNEQAMREEIEHLKAERDAAINRAKVAEDERDAVSSKCDELKQDGEQWKSAHDEVAACEQALAAHVERLHSFIEHAPAGTGVCMCGSPMAEHPHDNHSPCDEWDHYGAILLSDSPTTSLARLKAQWQAEALALATRYREAIEILAYAGILKDAEELKGKIERGDFSAEYAAIKDDALELGCQSRQAEADQ